MKVRVERIHPTRTPNHCVISGERDGGDLGFWVGPDIEAPYNSLVTPHVSIRMAKQWLEAADLVVDAKEHQRVVDELEAKEQELEKAEHALNQLKNRLTRVTPRRKPQKKVAA